MINFRKNDFNKNSCFKSNIQDLKQNIPNAVKEIPENSNYTSKPDCLSILNYQHPFYLDQNKLNFKGTTNVKTNNKNTSSFLTQKEKNKYINENPYIKQFVLNNSLDKKDLDYFENLENEKFNQLTDLLENKFIHILINNKNFNGQELKYLIKNTNNFERLNTFMTNKEILTLAEANELNGIELIKTTMWTDEQHNNLMTLMKNESMKELVQNKAIQGDDLFDFAELDKEELNILDNLFSDEKIQKLIQMDKIDGYNLIEMSKLKDSRLNQLNMLLKDNLIKKLVDLKNINGYNLSNLASLDKNHFNDLLNWLKNPTIHKLVNDDKLTGGNLLEISCLKDYEINQLNTILDNEVIKQLIEDNKFNGGFLPDFAKLKDRELAQMHDLFKDKNFRPFFENNQIGAYSIIYILKSNNDFLKKLNNVLNNPQIKMLSTQGNLDCEDLIEILDLGDKTEARLHLLLNDESIKKIIENYKLDGENLSKLSRIEKDKRLQLDSLLSNQSIQNFIQNKGMSGETLVKLMDLNDIQFNKLNCILNNNKIKDTIESIDNPNEIRITNTYDKDLWEISIYNSESNNTSDSTAQRKPATKIYKKTTLNINTKNGTPILEGTEEEKTGFKPLGIKGQKLAIKSNENDTHTVTSVDYIKNTNTEITQRRTLYDKNGDRTSTEIIRQSKIDPREYEILICNKNKPVERIGTVSTSADGKTITKELKSSNGTITKTTKTYNDKKSSFTYQIIDKNGNVLANHSRSSIKLDENHKITKLNGQSYDIKYKPDCIIVSKLNPDNSLQERIKLCAKQLDMNLMPIYKELAGDHLFALKKLNTMTVLGGSAKPGNANYCNYDNLISMSKELKEDTFGFIHELGHALDYKVYKLYEDKQLSKIFNKELMNYKKITTNLEGAAINYFTTLEHDNAGGSITEAIAETMALLSGVENNFKDIMLRGLILQEHFPETIAYISNYINQPLN